MLAKNRSLLVFVLVVLLSLSLIWHFILLGGAGKSITIVGYANAPLSHHTVTILPNKTALIIGASSKFADLYNSESNKIIKINNPLNFQHKNHEAVLLDTSKVLILEEGISEFYDIKTQEFSYDSNVQMKISRTNPSLIKLANGQILISGGYRHGQSLNELNSAEIYDPIKNEFKLIPTMKEFSSGHSSILWGSKVLLLGGDKKTIEIYDPLKSQFKILSKLPFSEPIRHADLLPDNKILIVSQNGILLSDDKLDAKLNIWIFDLMNNIYYKLFSENSPLTREASISDTCNGKILLAGGWDDQLSPLNRVFIFDLATKKLYRAPNLINARADFKITTLPNCRLLITGGSNEPSGHFLRSVEVFTP